MNILNLIKHPMRTIKNRRRYLKEYENYSSAKADCKSTNAYQNKELCSMIALKTEKLAFDIENKDIDTSSECKNLEKSLIKFMNTFSTNIINVLDFGGACGADYFKVRNRLPKGIKLNWVVVETKRMVSYAKSMDVNTSEIRFVSSLKDFSFPVDFIYSSSTLQYTSNPYKCLRDLLILKPKMIFFDRMMFNKQDKEFITVQKSILSNNGPGPLPDGYEDKEIFYPHTTLAIDRFSNAVGIKYSLETHINEPSECLRMKNGDVIGVGMEFLRKKLK